MQATIAKQIVMARHEWQLDIVLPSSEARDVVHVDVNLEMADVAYLGVATSK